MSLGFLDHMRVVPAHRIPGVVTCPLDEVLLARLVGVVCGADDWEGVEEVAAGALDWLRGFLPFANGIATAQTLRKVFRLLDTQALQRGFAAWAASLRAEAQGVIAVDGKTLRGSKTSPDGKGALHLVSAYATQAGLAQRAVDGKSNEITAIPELLDMLTLKGALASIDAMGTRKEIAGRIVDKGAHYGLALKGNQAGLHADAALFFADPVLAASCARVQDTDAGHGRIEERSCLAGNADWLADRHPPEFRREVQPPASLNGLDVPSRRAVFVPWKPSRRRGFGMGTRLSVEEPMLSTGLHLTSESTPRLERPAVHRRRHRPAHRQEDRPQKPRNPYYTNGRVG